MLPSPDDFVLLNDEPVAEVDDDLLGAAQTARNLANLIVASRRSTPFTVAIDAGWGMGKSSLMRQLRRELDTVPGVHTEWFNAWTSGADALEVLIKSVMLRFDRNIVRRAYHRLIERKRVLGVVRVVLTLGMSVFGLRGMVDSLWSQLAVDAKSRNDIRDVVQEMAGDWVRSGTPDGRVLVIFVDDLDRCAHEVVLAVCEAIKLYLDVPGLVFVIGCDQVVLRQNLVADLLQKIIQVQFPVVHAENTIQDLVKGFARRSHTHELFDDGLATLVGQHTKRNPRQIKRLINSFVVQYHLQHQWKQFGPEVLIRIIVLQHFYPDFYWMMVGADWRNPAVEFLDYADVWQRCASTDAFDTAVSAFFRSHGVEPPDPAAAVDDKQARLVELERQLPETFPQLVRDNEFVSLLRALSEKTSLDELREHLYRGVQDDESFAVNEFADVAPGIPVQQEYPRQASYGYPAQAPYTQAGPQQAPYLQTPPQQATSVGSAGSPPGAWHDGLASTPPPLDDLRGLHVVWVDDAFASISDGQRGPNGSLVGLLRARGARVSTFAELDIKQFEELRPDLLVSDITRGADENRGLDVLAEIRERGFDIPVVFYTLRVTPSRKERAAELGASVTADPVELQSWLGRIARELRARTNP